MLIIKSNPKLRYVGVAIYLVMFVLVALYVFVENDETKPLRHIFQPGYLIPIVVYTAGALLVSYFIFLILKKFIHVIFSFMISLFIGIPLGLVMIGKCIELLFMHD